MSSVKTICGRVYKIIDKRNPSAVLYIGSTETPLSARWSCHKVDAKRYSAKVNTYLLENGIDNFNLVLLEEGEFQNTISLRSREEYYRVLYNSPLNNNMCYTGLTKKQYNKRERNTPVICDCGTVSDKHGIYQHKKSGKHSKLVLSGFMRTGLSRRLFLRQLASPDQDLSKAIVSV